MLEHLINFDMTDIIVLLVSHPIIAVFLVLMMFLFMCDLVTFYRVQFTHLDFKSTIMSLGILGTFIGISIGLWEFDTAAIVASVPKLLSGLKIAFLTSVLGMFFSVLLAVIERFSARGADDKPLKDQVVEMTEQLKKQLPVLQDISTGVNEFDKQIGDFRTELKDQSEESRKLIESKISQANQTLEEALKKISEGANQQIIDALNESIRGFNENLTEQFGDNFRQLNDACLKLVEWQKAHKQDVESTHKQLGDSVAALVTIKETLDAVAKRNQEVIGTYNSLRDTIVTYDNQTKALTAHLEKYGALADKAKQMFVDANSRFTDISDAMGDFSKELKDKISTQSYDLGQSMTGLQKTVNAQSEALTKLAGDIVKSVNEMEGSLVSITEKMGEKYGDFLRGAEHIAQFNRPPRRDDGE